MHLRLFFLSFSCLALGTACGGQTDDSTSDTGAVCTTCVDGGVDAVLSDLNAAEDTSATAGATPPPRPSVGASDGATKWFVVKHWELGLTQRGTDTLSTDAWKDYGYDLDGRTTTASDSLSSANSCHRAAGSPSAILTDGNLGRDNNFGGHLMQTMKSLKSDVELSVNQSVATGGQTLLLRIDNVVGDDNANVPGALFLSGALPADPKFDGSDTYPVDASSVSGDISKPIVTFPSGYMSGGVWVSGELGTGSGSSTLPFFVSGFPAPLPVQGAVFVFHVSDGLDGTVAGAVRTSDVEPAFRDFFETFGSCPGEPTYDSIVSTFTDLADLVAKAPQFQDTSIGCDAISLGVGFELAPVQPPTTISPPPTAPPSPCP